MLCTNAGKIRSEQKQIGPVPYHLCSNKQQRLPTYTGIFIYKISVAGVAHLIDDLSLPKINTLVRYVNYLVGMQPGIYNTDVLDNNCCKL